MAYARPLGSRVGIIEAQAMRRREENVMSEQKNIEAVQKMYAAFGRGDVPAILEDLADDVSWEVNSQAAASIPWYAPLRGKRDVPKFFGALVETVEYTRFEPQALAATGDVVYCTVSFDMVVKKNRKKVTSIMFHRFTFKNGRVVEVRTGEDTAQVLAAWNAP
jgi:ketosteroid isomerase-like protein